MIYDIRLTITHRYDQPAANSRHLIRVLPKTIPGLQHVTTHMLRVFPDPSTLSTRSDFFGTSATSCAHMAPHSEMAIQLNSRVEMSAGKPWQDRSERITQICAQWQNNTDLGAGSPVHFLGPTFRLSPEAAITSFALDTCDPAQSAAQNVIRIGRALHDMMIFDGQATTVDTNAAEAFAMKRGVCQDFSHIMILALQALGIPAAYVSGYLRTLPPAGGVKLAGADAMHAWVRAWCGAAQGWIEYDPTNATLAGSDHIVVGYGRDYSDVAPVSGHLRSSGGQTNTQAVDVCVVG
uniref:transglutaminase family protein n=1 Tax=Yoonia sp. TaxID=2212373 RepID=UPI004047A570|tara:strand:+ start:2503 stop:3381 length:879 start_codon:yes stop_codon:yes gene_type:complete